MKKYEDMTRREKLVGISLLSNEDKEKVLKDSDWMIRREAYRQLGFTKKAFDDSDWRIRQEAYRKLGFTEKAFDDFYWRIRLEAYRCLGYTEKAFDDSEFDIRQEAETYFRLKSEDEVTLKISKQDLKLLDSIKDLKYKILKRDSSLLK